MLNQIIFCAILVILPLSGICQHVTTVSDQNELINVVDQQPEFPGGEDARINYFKTNIQLPKYWRPDSITGYVFTQFLVDTNGNIKNPKILRSLDPILDSIAYLAVKKMPRWSPAMQRGKPIGCMFNLPIKFGTNNKKKN